MPGTRNNDQIYVYLVSKQRGMEKTRVQEYTGEAKVKRECLGRLEGEWSKDLGVAGRSTEQKEEEQRVREWVGGTIVGRITDQEKCRGD